MLYFLTGAMQSGKTTWLRNLIELAEDRGLPLNGLITPAVFLDGVKTGIDLLLLPQRETLHLAVVDESAENARDTKGSVVTDGHAAVDDPAVARRKMKWRFDDEVIERANEHLSLITSDSPAPGLFLVDELGWLELDSGGGYTEALRILDEACYRNALVVVRPELLETALARWAKAAPLIISPTITWDTFFDSLD